MRSIPNIKKSISGGNNIFLSYFIPIFLCGLAAFDFANDGIVDKTILGAIFVLAMASLGYRIDGFIDETAERIDGDDDKVKDRRTTNSDKIDIPNKKVK